jgi:hypothetical protein
LLAATAGIDRHQMRASTYTFILITALFIVLLFFLYVVIGGQRRQHKGLRGATHRLILVPCHGIWMKEAYQKSDEWRVDPWLESKINDLEQHIEMSIELAKRDPRNVLVLFSGGETRESAGRRSEGQSYLELASKLDPEYFENNNIVGKNFNMEEFARDSQENLLFSVCRFKQITGRYPDIIDVVGFGYKKDRFMNEHRASIRFPKHRFGYFSPKGQEENSYAEMDHQVTIPQFQEDPFGCSPPLSDKKKGRNPFSQKHLYSQICPEMISLLTMCDTERDHGIKSKLPWE